MNVKKNYNKVKKLLEEKEIYRDSYNSLLARVWYDEMPMKNLLAVDFLHLLKNGQLSHPESIMRVRRKVQEDHKELRGKTYNYRKTKEYEQVKMDLGYGN